MTSLNDVNVVRSAPGAARFSDVKADADFKNSAAVVDGVGTLYGVVLVAFSLFSTTFGVGNDSDII